MGTCYIVERAVSEILESSSDTGSRVVLHRRQVDNLVYLVNHNTRHIRAGFPLSKKSRITINIRFVTTAARESLLNAHDSNLCRQQCLIAADVDLVGVPVVHNDVSCRNSERLNRADDLAYNLGGRTTRRCSRWIDLDSDHIARLNKLRPCLARGLLSGQLFHCPLKHTTHNGLRNTVAYDGVRLADLDDSGWEQPRHAQRRRFVVGKPAEFDGRHRNRGRLCPHHRIQPLHEQRGASNATGLDESTAIHKSVP